MQFKKFDGTTIDNVSEYVKQYFRDNPGFDYDLFVGCDSLPAVNKVTTFVVVVVIYKRGKGAHIIYSKVKDKTKLPIMSRLWKEVEISVEVAGELKAGGVLDYQFSDKHGTLQSLSLDIHLDLNSKVSEKSNKILDAATGYVKGMGFNVYSKPFAWCASYAADYVCRGRANSN